MVENDKMAPLVSYEQMSKERRLLESIFGRRNYSTTSFKPTGNSMPLQYHLAASDASLDYHIDSTRLIQLISKDYPLAAGPTKFKRSQREAIIAALKGQFQMDHFPLFGEQFETIKGQYVAAMISVDEIIIFASNDAKLAEIAALVKSFVVPDGNEVTYFYYSSGDLMTDHIDINDGDEEIILPELYPTIDIKLLCEEFNKSHEKILMLFGEPGTGKTSFIKYLISLNIYEKIAYVKDQRMFKDSDFWRRVTNDEYDLVIFDDIDDIMQSRKDNNEASFVSNLLSFSDGVIRRKTKIIMTTNQEIPEIDPAITRPGRIFDFLVLPSLTNEQARAIWTNVLGQDVTDFAERFGEANVTQASLISEYKRITVVKSERSYMKVGPKNYSVQQKLAELGIHSGAPKAGFGR